MTRFVASEQRRAWVGGGGGQIEGGVWQTKGATRRCGDSASAFTQAGGHKRGIGTGRSEGDGEPPSTLQTHAHAQTLTGAPHKSLSVTAVGF